MESSPTDLIQRARGRLLARLATSAADLLMAAPSKRRLGALAWLLEHIAVTEVTRERARKIGWLVDSGHPFTAWLERIASELTPLARRRWIGNVYVRQYFLAKVQRERFKQTHGFLPPYTIVVSPTGRCNYRCGGCWAAEYRGAADLPLELFARAVREARDVMGIHWVTISGGEPFLRRDLLQLFREFPDVFFLVYTNGSLITEAMAARLARLANVAPMISVEGGEALTDARRGEGAYWRAMAAMSALRAQRVAFGFSATATRDTADVIVSPEFVDDMIGRGALYGWYFHYCPIGRDPDAAQMPTPRQRSDMRHAIYRLRETRPIFLIDFWNDGPEVGGCMAGGRGYLHVSAGGDIEPCAFVHLATDNLRDRSLTDALHSPFFSAIRDGIPYDGNEIRPCMIIDRPEVLRQHHREHAPASTHPGADRYLTDPAIVEAIDAYADEYRAIADGDWCKGRWMRVFPERPATRERMYQLAAADRMVARWTPRDRRVSAMVDRLALETEAGGSTRKRS